MNQQSNNDDSFLVQRYRGGDIDAMGTLVNRYQGRLYNTILKICYNHEDALELTQDSFVKAIESIDKFQGKSSFYTYVFRIGVNLAINFSNRRKIVRFTAIDGSSGDSDGALTIKDFLVSGSVGDPAEIVANDEAIGILRKSIASLEDKYRVVIVLRDIEEMSYEQIAQTLELEAGTVKSRLFRARAMLKEKLLAVFEDLD